MAPIYMHVCRAVHARIACEMINPPFEMHGLVNYLYACFRMIMQYGYVT